MTTPASWHPLHKGLHWLTLALIITAWAAVELHEEFAKGDPWREWWELLHFTVGFTLLLTLVLRLYGRARYARPALIASPWQALASKAVHGLLYLVILAMPLTGMGMRQLAGKDTELFWLFKLPQITAINTDLAKQAAWIHKDFLWTALLTLVVIHVAGALWHHFIDKDDTLRRML
ncbi:cytochrome b [Alcanivorax sp. S6407]|uniref:cytochrome b n=1 Tax=Alcanivorax sp. S6407 TaxID=2926424 RepID=UPI001FF2C16F|nr:cytochrome b [Alcanivorax sp. S6407]MCK0154450.1 cytochrome b [Alcanivorax sp. S6407]